MDQIELVKVLVGAPLLVFGRRLFWLFVGGVGFVAGITLAPYIFGTQVTWKHYLLALVTGIVCAILATFLQRVAILLVGLLAGGYLAVNLAKMLSMDSLTSGEYYILLLVAGAILGAVLMAAIFEWALVVISSLTGALLIAQGVNLNPAMTTLLFAVLFFVGLKVQLDQRSRAKAKTKEVVKNA